ncbi:flagellar hook-basal body complex protein FliE [Thermosulfidibacter takaii ABI70S6]|uniref:Flagellar hook-basal body complex protein FliE n=1 Tax=Thermosulfidibacter takaii (strain DSM 17441 / JCM 13301 / NBRC 103674 / ABI70S6) TaxID=1298851 RepID=A0A0S3QSX1_THET7|nr:flagellar hook-basal body complex protein FliE [Thermosulfidibacter takaii]BAT71434.1 flagellar hook-basal body complex protein FliE [Thermosulfidibacter takaii ABI70S6]
MNNRIAQIYKNIAQQTNEGTKQQKTVQEPKKSFADVLKESLAEVNKLQLDAEEALKALATGKEEDIEKVMVTLQKADVSLKLLMEVRNKALEAYQEIMRMQV